MKKPKRISPAKLKKIIPRRAKKPVEPEVREQVPRITNETVAAHREEVLGSARKYIYPLQHSKHRIVIISVTLFIVAMVAFISYAMLALYKFQSYSTFLYRVTQVVPFPVARAGDRFVSYEDYLFELRRYTHFYEHQLNIDFTDERNKPQLVDFRHRALQKVINDSYVAQLAKKNDISVSSQEVEDQIAVVRSQNRLGGDQDVFEDVLKDYWAWSVDDFKRTLRSELLAQKVAATLDTATKKEAEKALAEIRKGKAFAEVAKQYSDDEKSKNSGGEFGAVVERTDRNLSAQAVDALFSLKPGQVSGLVNTGFALEILKNIEEEGDKIRGAHIVFTFKSVDEYAKDLQKQKPTQRFISLPEQAVTPPQS